MAKFQFDGDADLMRMLEKLEDADEICPKVLQACVGPLVTGIKRGYAAHHRTGDIEKSVKAGKPKKGKNGWYICVTPTGKSAQTIDTRGATHDRSKPVSNMEKAVHLEYGSKKQSPTPVIAPATRAAKTEVTAKMQQEYNGIVGGT